MNILLDTQLLLWWQVEPERVPGWIVDELQDPDKIPVFSVISIWEIVIKSALNRPDFTHDAALVRSTLLDCGWQELGLSGPHVLTVGNLRSHHGDPFDRALVAQASSEKLRLVTTDRSLGKYGSHVEVVKKRRLS